VSRVGTRRHTILIAITAFGQNITEVFEVVVAEPDGPAAGRMYQAASAARDESVAVDATL
jgi:hypothetical protein